MLSPTSKNSEVGLQIGEEFRGIKIPMFHSTKTPSREWCVIYILRQALPNLRVRDNSLLLAEMALEISKVINQVVLVHA